MSSGELRPITGEGIRRRFLESIFRISKLLNIVHIHIEYLKAIENVITISAFTENTGLSFYA
jgi:hypothetical protein